MSLLSQVIAYIVSPLATLLAVWVAYLSLSKSTQPQSLIYYRINPDVSSLIDLVIENIGGGTAVNVQFSNDIPINRFGIESPQNDSGILSKTGFPAISQGQKYIFIGGQYAGLADAVGDGINIVASYGFRGPTGFQRKSKESFLIGVNHMRGMPTRTSANQAIIDALKGPNKTTIQEIRDELRKISGHLQEISKK